MKYGIREAVDVTFKAIVPEGQDSVSFGSLTFAPFEPVLIFDTLKTATSEQAVTTVYAQGGRGNPRLIGWDGDKTLTLTMEDALISKEGLAILMNAELVKSKDATPTYEHKTKVFTSGITLSEIGGTGEDKNMKTLKLTISGKDITNGGASEGMFATSEDLSVGYGKCTVGATTGSEETEVTAYTFDKKFDSDATPPTSIRVDYYVKNTDGSTVSVDIDKGEFKGINFYVEGDTLFRDTDGQDHAAQLIYPRVKVQSNMSFSMAGSGDPSTFTFTCDAFPGTVKGQKAVNKKLLGAIQIFED